MPENNNQFDPNSRAAQLFQQELGNLNTQQRDQLRREVYAQTGQGVDFQDENTVNPDYEFEQSWYKDYASGVWNGFVVQPLEGFANLIPTLVQVAGVDENEFFNSWESGVKNFFDGWEAVYSEEANQEINDFGDINASHFWSGLGQGVGFVASLFATGGLATSSVINKSAKALKLLKAEIKAAKTTAEASKLIAKHGNKIAQLEKKVNVARRAASFITGTASMYPMIKEQAEMAGMSKANAARYALSVASLVSYTEGAALVWIGKIPARELNKQITKGAIKSSIKEFTKEPTKQGLKKSVALFSRQYGNAIKKYGANVFEGSAIEAGQEFVQTWIEHGAKKLYDEVFAGLTDEEDGFNETLISKKNFTESVFAATLGGIIGGGLSGAVNLPGRKNVNESAFSIIHSAVQNNDMKQVEKVLSIVQKSKEYGKLQPYQQKSLTQDILDMVDLSTRYNLAGIKDGVTQYKLFEIDRSQKRVKKQIAEKQQYLESHPNISEVEKKGIEKQIGALTQVLNQQSSMFADLYNAESQTKVEEKKAKEDKKKEKEAKKKGEDLKQEIEEEQFSFKQLLEEDPTNFFQKLESFEDIAENIEKYSDKELGDLLKETYTPSPQTQTAMADNDLGMDIDDTDQQTSDDKATTVQQDKTNDAVEPTNTEPIKVTEDDVFLADFNGVKLTETETGWDLQGKQENINDFIETFAKQKNISVEQAKDIFAQKKDSADTQKDVEEVTYDSIPVKETEPENNFFAEVEQEELESLESDYRSRLEKGEQLSKEEIQRVSELKQELAKRQEQTKQPAKNPKTAKVKKLTDDAPVKAEPITTAKAVDNAIKTENTTVEELEATLEWARTNDSRSANAILKRANSIRKKIAELKGEEYVESPEVDLPTSTTQDTKAIDIDQDVDEDVDKDLEDDNLIDTGDEIIVEDVTSSEEQEALDLIQRQLEEYNRRKKSKDQKTRGLNVLDSRIDSDPVFYNQIVNFFQSKFPNIPYQRVQEIVNKHGATVLGRVIELGIQVSDSAYQSTIIHEYAHVFLDLVADDKIVQSALTAIEATPYMQWAEQNYPNESKKGQKIEALAQAMADQGLKRLDERFNSSIKSSLNKILRSIWKRIKSLFGVDTGNNVIEDITDMFLNSGSNLGVEALSDIDYAQVTNTIAGVETTMQKALTSLQDFVRMMKINALADNKMLALDNKQTLQRMAIAHVIKNNPDIAEEFEDVVNSGTENEKVIKRKKIVFPTQEDQDTFNKAFEYLASAKINETASHSEQIAEMVDNAIAGNSQIKGNKKVPVAISEMITSIINPKTGSVIPKNIVYQIVLEASNNSLTKEDFKKNIQAIVKKPVSIDVQFTTDKILQNKVVAAQEILRTIELAEAMSKDVSASILTELNSVNMQQFVALVINEDMQVNAETVNRSVDNREILQEMETVGGLNIKAYLESKGISIEKYWTLSFTEKINLFTKDTGNAVNFLQDILGDSASKAYITQLYQTVYKQKIKTVKDSVYQTKEDTAHKLAIISIAEHFIMQQAYADNNTNAIEQLKKPLKATNRPLSEMVSLKGILNNSLNEYFGLNGLTSIFTNKAGNQVNSISKGYWINTIQKLFKNKSGYKNKWKASPIYKNNPIVKMIQDNDYNPVILDAITNVISGKVSEHNNQTSEDHLIASFANFLMYPNKALIKMGTNDRNHTHWLPVTRLRGSSLRAQYTQQAIKDAAVMRQLLNEYKSRNKNVSSFVKNMLSMYNDYSYNYAYEINGEIVIENFFDLNDQFANKDLNDANVRKELENDQFYQAFTKRQKRMLNEARKIQKIVNNKGVSEMLKNKFRNQNINVEDYQKIIINDNGQMDINNVYSDFILNDAYYSDAINDVLIGPYMRRAQLAEKGKANLSNIIKRSSGYDSGGTRANIDDKPIRFVVVKFKTKALTKTIKEAGEIDASDSFSINGSRLVEKLKSEYGSVNEQGGVVKDMIYQVDADGKLTYIKMSSLNQLSDTFIDGFGSDYAKLNTIVNEFQKKYPNEYIKLIDKNAVKGDQIHQEAIDYNEMYEAIENGDIESVAEKSTYTQVITNYVQPFNLNKDLSKVSLDKQKVTLSTQLMNIVGNIKTNMNQEVSEFQEMIVEMLKQKLGVVEGADNYYGKNSRVGVEMQRTQRILSLLESKMNEMQDEDMIALIQDIKKQNEKMGRKVDATRRKIKALEKKYPALVNENNDQSYNEVPVEVRERYSELIFKDKNTIGRFDHPTLYNQTKQVIASALTKAGIKVDMPGAYLHMMPDFSQDESRLQENEVKLPWSMFGSTEQEARDYLASQPNGIPVSLVRVPASGPVSSFNAKVVDFIDGQTSSAILPHEFLHRADADHDGDKVFVYRNDLKTVNKKVKNAQGKVVIKKVTETKNSVANKAFEKLHKLNGHPDIEAKRKSGSLDLKPIKDLINKLGLRQEYKMFNQTDKAELEDNLSFGASGIGIYAVMGKLLNILNQSKAQLKSPENIRLFRKTENGKLEERNVPIQNFTVDNSENIELLLQAALDMTKDPILLSTGITRHTISSSTVMSMLGLKMEDVLSILTSKYVRKYNATMSNRANTFHVVNDELSTNTLQDVVDKAEINIQSQFLDAIELPMEYVTKVGLKDSGKVTADDLLKIVNQTRGLQESYDGKTMFIEERLPIKGREFMTEVTTSLVMFKKNEKGDIELIRDENQIIDEKQLGEDFQNEYKEYINLKTFQYFNDLSVSVKALIPIIQLDKSIPVESKDVADIMTAWDNITDPKKQSANPIDINNFVNRPLVQHHLKVLQMYERSLKDYFVTELDSYYATLSTVTNQLTNKAKGVFVSVNEYKKIFDYQVMHMISQKFIPEAIRSDIEAKGVQTWLNDFVNKVSKMKNQSKGIDVDTFRFSKAYSAIMQNRHYVTTVGYYNDKLKPIVENYWSQRSEGNIEGGPFAVENLIEEMDDALNFKDRRSVAVVEIAQAIENAAQLVEPLSEIEADESTLKFIEHLNVRTYNVDGKVYQKINGSNKIRFMSNKEAQTIRKVFESMPKEMQEEFMAYNLLANGLSRKLNSFVKIMNNTPDIRMLTEISKASSDKNFFKSNSIDTNLILANQGLIKSYGKVLNSQVAKIMKAKVKNVSGPENVNVKFEFNKPTMMKDDSGNLFMHQGKGTNQLLYLANNFYNQQGVTYYDFNAYFTNQNETVAKIMEASEKQNQYHPDWKALVQAVGEEQAYVEYVLNDNEIPPVKNYQRNESYTLEGETISYRTTTKMLNDNRKLAKKIVDRLKQLFPEVIIDEDIVIKEKLKDDSVKGLHVRNAFQSIVGWSYDATLDTPPHEYAHHYIDMFRAHPLIQEGINKYGEERLAQIMGEKFVQEVINETESQSFARKIWNMIKSLFRAPEVSQIIFDNFYKGYALGDVQPGTGVKQYQKQKVYDREENSYVPLKDTEYESILHQDKILDKDFNDLLITEINTIVETYIETNQGLLDSQLPTEVYDQIGSYITGKISYLKSKDVDADGKYRNVGALNGKLLDDVLKYAQNTEVKQAIVTMVKANENTKTGNMAKEQVRALENNKPKIYNQALLTIQKLNQIEQRLYKIQIAEKNITIGDNNYVNKQSILKMAVSEIDKVFSKREEILNSLKKYPGLKPFVELMERLSVKYQINNRIDTKWLSGGEHTTISNIFYHAFEKGNHVKAKIMQEVDKVWHIDSIDNNLKMGSRFYHPKKSINEIEGKEFSFRDRGNLIKAKLTWAEILNVYMINRQQYPIENQRNGRQELLANGIVLDQSIEGRNIPRNTNLTFTQKTLDDIIATVETNPKAMENVNQMSQVFDTMLPYISKTYFDQYGSELESVNNYFPLLTGNSSLEQQRSLKSIDFLKSNFSRIGTKKPIRITDVNETVSSYVFNGAQYAAYAIPIENARAVLKPLKKKYEGTPTEKYLDSIDGNINRHEDSRLLFSNQAEEGAYKVLNKVMNNFSVAVLGMNVPVMFKQPVSYLAAKEVINAKYLQEAGWGVKGIVGINPKEIWQHIVIGEKAKETLLPVEFQLNKNNRVYKLIEQYSPILNERFGGVIDREMGETKYDSRAGQDIITVPGTRKINQRLRGKDQDIQISKVRLMEGIKIFDAATVMSIWKAVEAETKAETNLQPGTDEFNQRVAMRTEEIVTKTQPTFDMNNRANLSAMNNPYARMLSMFSSARSKLAQLILDGFVEMVVNPTKENKIKFVKRFVNIAVLSSAGILAVDLIREGMLGRIGFDDEDEVTSLAISKMINNGTGLFYGVGTIVPVIISRMDDLPWYQTTQHPLSVLIDETGSAIAYTLQGDMAKAFQYSSNVMLKSQGLPMFPYIVTKEGIKKITGSEVE